VGSSMASVVMVVAWRKGMRNVDAPKTPLVRSVSPSHDWMPNLHLIDPTECNTPAPANRTTSIPRNWRLDLNLKGDL